MYSRQVPGIDHLVQDIAAVTHKSWAKSNMFSAMISAPDTTGAAYYKNKKKQEGMW